MRWVLILEADCAETTLAVLAVRLARAPLLANGRYEVFGLAGGTLKARHVSCRRLSRALVTHDATTVESGACTFLIVHFPYVVISDYRW